MRDHRSSVGIPSTPEASPGLGPGLRRAPASRYISGRVLVLLVRRGSEVIVPRGSAVLQLGDQVTTAGDANSVRRSVAYLGSRAPVGEADGPPP